MFIVKNVSYVLILMLVMAILLAAFETTASAGPYGRWFPYQGGWDSGWYGGQHAWYGGFYGGGDYGLRYYGSPYWAYRPWYGNWGPRSLFNCRYRSGWYDPYRYYPRLSGWRGTQWIDNRPSRFGAIAYSPTTGAYGYSSGYYNRIAAQKEAIADCGVNDARVIVWARNRWIALAVGDRVGVYGWAWSGTRARARSLALEGCRQQTSGCHIAISVWTGN